MGKKTKKKRMRELTDRGSRPSSIRYGIRYAVYGALMFIRERKKLG